VTEGIVELFVEATTMPRSTVINIYNFHVRSLKGVLIKKKHPKFHVLNCECQFHYFHRRKHLKTLANVNDKTSFPSYDDFMQLI